MIATIAGALLVFLEVFQCYEASVPNVPVACYPRSLPCRLYNDWMLILLNTVLPSIFMAIFGSLTIRNIRARIVQATEHHETTRNVINNQLRLRLNGRNISKMLLIQLSLRLLIDEV